MRLVLSIVIAALFEIQLAFSLCSNQYSCSTCTENSQACGWCPISNECTLATNSCPIETESIQFSCNCSDYKSCYTCAQQNCDWCQSGICFNSTSDNLGDCDSTWISSSGSCPEIVAVKAILGMTAAVFAIVLAAIVCCLCIIPCGIVVYCLCFASTSRRYSKLYQQNVYQPTVQQPQSPYYPPQHPPQYTPQYTTQYPTQSQQQSLYSAPSQNY